MTENAKVTLTEYRGFRVEVSEQGYFYGMLDDIQFSESSLKELKGSIDVHLGKQAKTRKLSLPVVLSSGTQATLTGLHLRTGEGLGLPEGTRYQNAYPLVDWIVAAIDRRQLLSKEMKRIESELYPYTVETSYRFGGGRDTNAHVNEYAAALDKLETGYAEKLAAAKLHEPEGSA